MLPTPTSTTIVNTKTSNHCQSSGRPPRNRRPAPCLTGRAMVIAYGMLGGAASDQSGGKRHTATPQARQKSNNGHYICCRLNMHQVPCALCNAGIMVLLPISSGRCINQWCGELCHLLAAADIQRLHNTQGKRPRTTLHRLLVRLLQEPVTAAPWAHFCLLAAQ